MLVVPNLKAYTAVKIAEEQIDSKTELTTIEEVIVAGV